MIVTSGGITKSGKWKSERSEFPGHILMPRFKAKFTLAIKEALKSGKIKTKKPISVHLSAISKIHKDHWQFYTERITQKSSVTILYVLRYVKKMILSEKRIAYYNSDEVGFFTSLERKGKLRIYRIADFIKCVVQHIPEKHFIHIRNYGFYANASKKYTIAANLWSPIKKTVNKITWQARQWYREKKDPLYCYTCKQAYKLLEVVQPKSWKILCS